MEFFKFNKIFFILLFCLSGCVEKKTTSITIRRNGNQTSIKNNKDVISHEVKPDAKGLKDSEYLDKLLGQQDYCKVLDLIAGESDDKLKAQWLYKKVNEGHAILMFELSAQLAKTNGKIEEVLKWYSAGIIRAMQDSRCCEDFSVEAGISVLQFKYGSIIKKSYNLEESQLKKLSYQAWHDAIEFVETLKKLPSPLWIGYHGIKSIQSVLAFKCEDPGLKPKIDWDRIRSSWKEEFKKTLINIKN